MNINRPFILISNDDGYHANGIKFLVSFLKEKADLLVCAPESARSGFSCAFSATTPLRLKRRHNMGDVEVWSCNGTPVDCVKLALDQLCTTRKPDLILGGLGDDVCKIVDKVLAEGLPKGICLNVNFPERPPFKGVKICRMTFGRWVNEVVKEHHPRGYDYFWMVGHFHNDEPEAADSDQWALNHGYIAITPTKMDVTAYEYIEHLNEWNL